MQVKNTELYRARAAHHIMDSRLPPWEQNPAGPPPPSRLCPQGHILAIIDGQPPSYNGGWMCDMCSAHLPPHTESVLHCKFIFPLISPSIS
jgi:hypothetical protein